MPVSKYFYSGSPFIPNYDLESIVDESIKQIANNIFPTMAIAKTIFPMMKFHIEKNLLPNLKSINADFQTSQRDLSFLNYGYELPFDALYLAFVYTNVGSKIAAINEYIPPNQNELTNQYRLYFHNNLDALRYLLQKDNTGIGVLRYLVEKPFYRDDYFDTGHEFADFVFQEVCCSVAVKLISP